MTQMQESILVLEFGNETQYPIRTVWAYLFFKNELFLKYYPEHNNPSIARELIEHKCLRPDEELKAIKARLDKGEYCYENPELLNGAKA
jgi:hypothetical protein